MNEADPRVKRTRQLLQTALGELLAEKSFHDITVQDIAERATLNRATFYAHFQDKFELLDYSVRQAFKQTLAARLSVDAALNEVNLRQLIVTVCEFVGQLYDHCASSPTHAQFQQVVETQVKAQLYELLLAWLTEAQSGGKRGTAAPEQAATVASWAIYGVAQRWGQGERALSSEEWARQALPLLLAPIRASLT